MIRVLFAFFLFNVSALGTTDSTFEQDVAPFLKEHCNGCHDATKAKAGFRTDQLSADLIQPRMVDHWKEVFDRINAGEMPPEDEPRPDARKHAAVVTWINAKLREADLAAKNAGGQTPMRRLNRDEYANTIRDLLHLDENFVRPLIEDLPGDGRAEGFDRLGVGLYFDQTQMERALQVAEKIAAKAIVDVGQTLAEANVDATKDGVSSAELSEKPPKVVVAEAENNARSRSEGRVGPKTLGEPMPRVWKPDGIELVQGWPNRNPETEKFGSVDSCNLDELVTEDGYYRVKIHAWVDKRGGSEGSFLLEYATSTPVQLRVELPVAPGGITEHTLFLRAGEPGMKRSLKLLWTDTRNAVMPEPVRQMLVGQQKRQAGLIRDALAAEQDVSALQQELDEIKTKMAALNTPQRIWNPALDREMMPVLHLDKIEVEGPIEAEWPPKSHKSLFFAGDTRADETYAREIFTRFLPRAYRRPVSDDEIESIISIVRAGLESKHMNFTQAMRHGLERVLCSSGFWFLERETQSAPAYALASRLSYFLWSTMPDDELLALAASGKIIEPSVLAAQVDRLLNDSRSNQFVRNFGGQWLGVREFGSVEPANEYRDYDTALKDAGSEEAYAFFAEVLQNDLPVTNFIDSDFAMVNERLAKHYGIDGVSGKEFRRVALKPEHHRGGVLGMAGLLTYLADGTRTLPMRRGSWVLANFFNDPPGNPPPNAGEIQPNAAGANLTVRERLEQHRSDETCASCHAKLDPYGLALENYDAIGMWRDRANGEGIRANKAPPIDPSGSFLNGKSFQSVEDYKALLLEQKDEFARCLAIKMLTYALCRPVGYTDHETVDALVADLMANDYRMKSLVKSIVLSPAFQTK